MDEKSNLALKKSVQNSFKIVLKFYNCNCKGRNSITATADVSDKLDVDKSFRTQDAQYQWSFFSFFVF